MGKGTDALKISVRKGMGMKDKGLSPFSFFLVSCLSLLVLVAGSCQRILPETGRKVVAEVKGGTFLYEDELEQIIPADMHGSDSASLADQYIKKWATDILMYEKAKRNISDMAEIDRLVNEYRKTLTIHQYQQRLVEQSRAKEPEEEAIRAFYDTYGSQMVMKENMLKGLFLVVPADAPHIRDVREWVRKADTGSIENIEKYTLQNAIGYDCFTDTWLPLSAIARKWPAQIKNPANFLSSNSMVEATDSTYLYLLKISEYCVIGQPEPYDLARERIINILSAQSSGGLILEIEEELYNDAVATGQLIINK